MCNISHTVSSRSILLQNMNAQPFLRCFPPVRAIKIQLSINTFASPSAVELFLFFLVVRFFASSSCFLKMRSTDRTLRSSLESELLGVNSRFVVITCSFYSNNYIVSHFCLNPQLFKSKSTCKI